MGRFRIVLVLSLDWVFNPLWLRRITEYGNEKKITHAPLG